MSDPAWSQAFILQDGANFTFPDYQTCVHANTGSCQITALSAIAPSAGWTFYEIHVTVADAGTTYLGVGFLAQAIALQTTQNIRANPSQGGCSWVEDHSGGASGGVYNNGSEALSGPNLVYPTFKIGMLVNAELGKWAYTLDGTNWNGTNTEAQILAETGVITMGYAGPYLPFLSAQDYEGSNVAFTASIYASEANCTYALPAGAVYLAASPVLTVSSATCLPGDAVQIDWTAANAPVSEGLNYLLDNGSPAACTGSATGTAGTAIGPVLSGFHSIALQDQASLSESNWTGFYVSNPPSGAGTLVYESSGTSLSSVAVNFTVDLPIGFAFDFYMQGQSTSGTVQLTGGNDFGISAAGTQTPDYVTGGGFSEPDLPDYTPQNQNGWIGVAPATGPTYASVTTSTSVQGSVSLVEGVDGAGTLTATITNNGSVSTYSHVVENYAPFTLGFIDSSTGFPGHDTTYSYYLGVYTPALPESISITAASYVPGTLTLSGTFANATLGTLSISSDGGETFTPSSTLDPGSNVYTATLNGTFAAATYELQVKDDTTGDTSNSFPFVLTLGACPLMVMAFA